MQRVVVFGANGLLGSHLMQRIMVGHARASSGAAIGYLGDIRNKEMIAQAMDRFTPDTMVNCAAYTNMDAAEKDSDTAFQVNAVAVRNLCSVAEKHGALLVHYSTGGVFNGNASRDTAFCEIDKPRTVGAYCKSKLAGERVAQEYDRSIIIRTHHLYGSCGKNRASQMIETLRGAGVVRADTSQAVLPTWAGHVAHFTMRLLCETRPRGIYHAVSSGQATTWFEFASLLLEGIRTGAVESTVQEGAAPRPKRCLIGGTRRVPWKIPSWRQGVADYLKSEEVAA